VRAAGFTVQARHAKDPGTLTELLAGQPWDLLLSAAAIGDYRIEQGLAAVRDSGADLPVIVLLDTFEAETAAALLNQGAAACVPDVADDYLSGVIRHEIRHLHERREFRETRARYQDSEKRIRILSDHSRDAIAYIKGGKHLYTNPQYRELFGYMSGEEMENMPMVRLIAPENQAAFVDLLHQLDADNPPSEPVEIQMVNNSDGKFNATVDFSRARFEDDPCIQVLIKYRTGNSGLEQELEQLRKKDLLTGLYNRQHFMHELNEAVGRANRGEAQSALLYIEPDNFAAIKEQLGIGGSDLILTDIANLMRKHLRDSDILARYEGNIFTAIVQLGNSKEIEHVAGKIRDVFKGHIFEVDERSVTLTCSIGVIQINEASANAKRVFGLAESACNIAKADKGDAIHVMTETDLLATRERDRAWAMKIRRAIKENAFHLVYQPIVSLHEQPNEAYEVLIRMQGRDGKLIMPGEFLPIAEQVQLMSDIDRWVMKSSAKAMLEKRRDGKETRFFIKLSVDSIKEPALLPWISKLLKAARLHGACFVFEASERVALRNLKETKIFADGLKELNCGFALDHVGSESQDFNYLNHFDVNFMKIDGGIIRDLTSKDENQELVKAITELARGKKIETIAEHVQDPNCLAILWQHGVNYIQGHYLQRPGESLNYDFSGE
jgi:diguanylate cyclase (GGDEF)-like protein/PAS domain S-box-containing protein